MIDFDGFSTDTRLIKKRIYFWLLKEKNNGNKFIKEAFKKGAACAVTDYSQKNEKRIIK